MGSLKVKQVEYQKTILVRITHPGLPQLEKIQEVLPSRRDEAHFRSDVSRLIISNLWIFKRVLHNLCCNSRSSPTYPSPLERKHERPAHIQRSPFSAS